jgi:hypothetical protein
MKAVVTRNILSWQEVNDGSFWCLIFYVLQLFGLHIKLVFVHVLGSVAAFLSTTKILGLKISLTFVMNKYLEFLRFSTQIGYTSKFLSIGINWCKFWNLLWSFVWKSEFAVQLHDAWKEAVFANIFLTYQIHSGEESFYVLRHRQVT